MADPVEPVEQETWQTTAQRLQAEVESLRTQIAELQARPLLDPAQVSAVSAEIATLRGRLEATESQAAATLQKTEELQAANQSLREAEAARQAAATQSPPVEPPSPAPAAVIERLAHPGRTLPKFI